MHRIRHFVVVVAALVIVQGCVTISVPASPGNTATPRATTTASPAATPSPTAAPATATVPPATPSATAPQSTATAAPSTGTPSTEPTATATTTGGRPVFATVDEAYHQQVSWHDCAPNGLTAQCATVFVPTSYEDPSLGTTGIAVAQFQTSFLGSNGHLLVNPGGPGAAGIDFAAQLVFAAFNLATSYDFVGFDPRGTGQSDPLVCLGTPALDELNAFDPTPETDTERQQGIDLIDEQGQACETNTGLLADHVTTVETARDMDVIRAVLGDDKMDYFGFSYGTFLGTTYAALFPDKVDRFVLDGALAPGLNTIEATEVQTQGFQTAVDSYIADCLSQTTCPLGTSASAAGKKLRQLLVDVDTNPLPTDDPARPLTQSLATYGMILTMYDIGFWPQLSSALTAAFSGDGQPLLTLADQYLGRSGGEYINNELQANQAINCLDEQIAGGPTQIPEFEVRRRLADLRRHLLWHRRPWLRRLAAAHDFDGARLHGARHATDRRCGHDPRSGDAVGVGPGARTHARPGRSADARRRWPHRVPVGQPVHHRQRRRVLPGWHSADRRHDLLSR